MTNGLEPTETTDHEITVIVLAEPDHRERIACSSFVEAVRVVKARDGEETTTKIEDRTGDIVFTSEEMDIEDWENEWERAKRRLAVDVEEHECPYNSVGCVADDLCVQCQMDEIKSRD